MVQSVVGSFVFNGLLRKEFTLSDAATLSFDALRLLRMSRRGEVEGLRCAWHASLRKSTSKDHTTVQSLRFEWDERKNTLLF